MEKDYDIADIFNAGAHAIRRVNGWNWDRGSHGPRLWHVRLQDTYALHPLIHRILHRDGVRPADWQLLLLEWPHVSTEDEVQIAYTRTEVAGLDFIDNGPKRQTRTSIGKYLARHWPHVRDDVRRDWAGRFAPAKYEIWDTMEGIISGVELGPQSCMKSSSNSIPFNHHHNKALCAWHAGDKTQHVAWDHHPYICYAPKFGWRMAVRLDAGKPDIVMGRCLVNANDMSYVRSYKRGESDGDYSHSDEKLEAWLHDQGYSHDAGWGGHKLAVYDHPDNGVMVPYIDGDVQSASHEGTYLRITDRGELEGDNTDGRGGTERESMGDCDRCDTTVCEGDDYLWAGQDQDTLICESCALCYTEVRGNSSGLSGYTTYYVRDNNVVTVDGVDYDEDNLPDFIHELHNGEMCHEDNCVYLDEENEYYETDDDDIVQVDGAYYLKDSDTVVKCADDQWRKRDDCWECAHTSDWYSDDVDSIEIDGETYHPNTLKQWLLDAGQTTLDLE